jgi:hypothetical protein
MQMVAVATGVCGNGVAEAGELCDGKDLKGMTCASMGANPIGMLSCNSRCMFDTFTCSMGASTMAAGGTGAVATGGTGASAKAAGSAGTGGTGR